MAKSIEKIRIFDEKISQKEMELKELKERRDKLQGKILSSVLKSSDLDFGDIIELISNKKSTNTPENSAQNEQNSVTDNVYKKAGVL